MINIYATGCTTASNSGTGQGACDLASFGDFRGMDITENGNTFTIASDVFLTKHRTNILSKKTFPLTDLFNFEQNTPDNEVATSSIGIKYEIRAGKPEFTLTYTKSACFHRSVFEKKAHAKWGAKFYFDKGVLLAKSVDGTKLKEFDCGMFSVGTLKLQQGTDPQQTKVMFQLTNAEEFNTRWVFLSWEEVGADLNDENGVIETVVEYVGATTANGATTTVVDVKSACNGSAIAGLTGSTKWKIGGTQASATTISNVTESATVVGRYTITHTALAEDDTIQPTLNNGTYDAVEDVLLNKYAGKATLRTVVA